MEFFVSYIEQWSNKQFFQSLIFFDPDTDRQECNRSGGAIAETTGKAKVTRVYNTICEN